MIATVNSGKDLHSENCKKVYGIDYESIKDNLAKAEEEHNEQDMVHYKMLYEDFYSKRKFIKALSFAITYGAGASKIARDLRITIPEAEKLINDFYTAYPKVREWQDRTFLHAIRDGYIETPFGRKRETKLIKGRMDAYKALVQNDVKISKQLKRDGEYWTLRDEQKQCKNSPIQSTATDMCSWAAIKVKKAFIKQALRAQLYFWVHDSIVFHCHIDDAVKAIKLVADIMENQVKYDGDPVNYRVEAEVGLVIALTSFVNACMTSAYLIGSVFSNSISISSYNLFSKSTTGSGIKKCFTIEPVAGKVRILAPFLLVSLYPYKLPELNLAVLFVCLYWALNVQEFVFFNTLLPGPNILKLPIT